MKVISWYSAGITSTIATMKAIEHFGANNVEIIFFETGAHHEDNVRFMRECEEKLFKKAITVRRNKKYKDLWDVLSRGYINSPGGAYCTHQLKKRVREKIEAITDYNWQVFGFEFERAQVNRAIRFVEQNPKSKAIFPLIDLKLTKTDCLDIIKKHDIELPMMYRLGFTNNNCVGCVKGGMGYWNKVRVEFPEVFDRMAKMERQVKATCLKKNKRKLYLDELDPEAGRMDKPVVDECGVICPTEFTHIDSPNLDLVMNGQLMMSQLGEEEEIDI